MRDLLAQAASTGAGAHMRLRGEAELDTDYVRFMCHETLTAPDQCIRGRLREARSGTEDTAVGYSVKFDHRISSLRKRSLVRFAHRVLVAC